MNIEITIKGPGLMVNQPARILINNLLKVGYCVSYNDFAGKDDIEGKNWLELDVIDARNYPVNINIVPLPWGG